MRGPVPLGTSIGRARHEEDRVVHTALCWWYVPLDVSRNGPTRTSDADLLPNAVPVVEDANLPPGTIPRNALSVDCEQVRIRFIPDDDAVTL